MNILTIWIVNRFRKVSNKASTKVREKLIRIEYTKQYKDQQLWEIKFSDGALVCVYDINLATCSCKSTKTWCKHARILLQLCNIDHILDFDPLTNSRFRILVQKHKKNNNTRDQQNSTINECVVCLGRFSHETKYFLCGKCKHVVHKYCWKKWDIVRKREGRVTDCIICRDILNEDSLIDNEGFKI
jgi:hypothetical protein